MLAYFVNSALHWRPYFRQSGRSRRRAEQVIWRGAIIRGLDGRSSAVRSSHVELTRAFSSWI